MSGSSTIKTRDGIMLEDRELCGDGEDEMHDGQRAMPPGETAARMRAMPSMNAARGRRRSGQVAEVADATTNG
jgi:hypothetical protein